ncbi:hypothetical protein [Nostoc sp.]
MDRYDFCGKKVCKQGSVALPSRLLQLPGSLQRLVASDRKTF